MSRIHSLAPRQDLGLTILRVVTGAIFVAHGAQKLFVFGFDGVAGAFGQMGIPMPWLLGPFVGLLEFFGGLALIAGLGARLVSLGLAGTMVVAIFVVHLANGFFNPGGIEFPLSLLAATLALAVSGAGRWSLDARIGRREPAEIEARAAVKRAA